MRRAFWSLSVLVSMALATSTTFAGAPQPFTFDGTGFRQYTSRVAQQSYPFEDRAPDDYVRNPIPSCVWAVDDHAEWTSSGSYIDPGVSVSFSGCIISDWPVTAPYGFFGLKLYTKLPTHQVSVCYSPQDRCFPVSGAWDADYRAYVWWWCGRAHYNRDDPALVEIPDSNGGTGVITTVTATITNTGPKADRQVYGLTGFSSDVFFHAGCTGPGSLYWGPPDEYPFRWEPS